jgi:hypothetical protein
MGQVETYLELSLSSSAQRDRYTLCFKLGHSASYIDPAQILEYFPIRYGRMEAIMLIEIWEHLRGYDKWIQTEAKIESSNLEKVEASDINGNPTTISESDDKLVWTDKMGQRQSAEFCVPDDSPLYQFIGGETVTIRYNPADPGDFYYRDLMRSQVHRAFKMTLIGILVTIGPLLRLLSAILRDMERHSQ